MKNKLDKTNRLNTNVQTIYVLVDLKASTTVAQSQFLST